LNLKAVLFDLGGTLLDFEHRQDFDEVLKLAHQALRTYLVSEGFDISLQKIVDVTNGIFDAYFEFTSRTFLEIDKSILYSAKLYHLGIEEYANEELIRGAMTTFEDQIINNYYIYEDTKSILSMLKERKVKLGLVSNNNCTYVFDQLLQIYDLANYFDATVVSNEIGIRKPHKGIFFHCLNQLKVKSENAMFVGDRLHEDIQGAKNAGMKSVWINRNNETLNHETPKPDYTISNLSALLEILL
jgi:putative hydrolase of the HAD superfamily